jgi:hypothetical protein
MKTLDDFMQLNTGHFNDEEPREGHFDRFEEKLDRFDRHRSLKAKMFILKIAAVLMIGLFVSLAAFRTYFNKPAQFSGGYVTTVDAELNEAENFYTSQLNQYKTKIQSLRFNNDQDEKKMVLDEFSEMDKQVKLMKEDLKQNPEDERVIHAIINLYQVKIEMMDMIISRTQQTANSIL